MLGSELTNLAMSAVVASGRMSSCQPSRMSSSFTYRRLESPSTMTEVSSWIFTFQVGCGLEVEAYLAVCIVSLFPDQAWS